MPVRAALDGRSNGDSPFPRGRAWRCLRGLVLAMAARSAELRTAASARTNYEHELDSSAIWQETRTLKCKAADLLESRNGGGARWAEAAESQRRIAGCVETASADSAPGLARRVWLWRGFPP